MTPLEQRRARLAAAIGEHRADDVAHSAQLQLVFDLLARAASCKALPPEGGTVAVAATAATVSVSRRLSP